MYFISICASRQHGVRGAADASPLAPRHPRLPQPFLHDAAYSTAARQVSAHHSNSNLGFKEQQRPPPRMTIPKPRNLEFPFPLPTAGAEPALSFQPSPALLLKTQGIAQLFLLDAFVEQKRAARSNPGTQVHSDQQQTAHTRAVLPGVLPLNGPFMYYGKSAQLHAGVSAH